MRKRDVGEGGEVTRQRGCRREFLPVREPSSWMRIVMRPSLKVSPSLARTKLMGTVGVADMISFGGLNSDCGFRMVDVAGDWVDVRGQALI